MRRISGNKSEGGPTVGKYMPETSHCKLRIKVEVFFTDQALISDSKQLVEELG